MRDGAGLSPGLTTRPFTTGNYQMTEEQIEALLRSLDDIATELAVMREMIEAHLPRLSTDLNLIRHKQ